MAAEGIAGLFTPAASVSAVETRHDEIDESLLWPQERDALGEVVHGRRWDWVSGRRCARLAMAELGVEPQPVLSGPKREPLWPAGLVGAITHTHGYAAAVVGHSHLVRSVGIDAEPDAPLPDGVIRRVASAAERAHLDEVAAAGVEHPDRVLFCVKEAIYKAWFPLAQRWLGFEDAAVSFDGASGAFRAELAVDGPFRQLEGRWTTLEATVVAGVEVPVGD